MKDPCFQETEFEKLFMESVMSVKAKRNSNNNNVNSNNNRIPEKLP